MESQKGQAPWQHMRVTVDLKRKKLKRKNTDCKTEGWGKRERGREREISREVK